MSIQLDTALRNEFDERVVQQCKHESGVGEGRDVCELGDQTAVVEVDEHLNPEFSFNSDVLLGLLTLLKAIIYLSLVVLDVFSRPLGGEYGVALIIIVILQLQL